MPTIGSTREGENKAFGWVLFAGMMLCMVGAAKVLQGFLLIVRDEIYVTGPAEGVVAIGDVTTWGWILLIIGVINFAAGVGVVVGNQYARWFGVAAGALAILGQLPVFFGDHPLWSVMVVTLSVLVIYGLVMYGDSEDLDF